MPRRRSGLADLLVALPWWVSALLAGGSYGLLAWVAPRLEIANFRLSNNNKPWRNPE